MKFQHTQTIAYMLLSASTVFVQANNRDRFNYGNTDEDDKDYGPEDWNEVSCDDPGNCEGFPDSWETAIGWDLEDTNAACEICVDNDIDNNNCKWCPADEESCGQHRQSPIDLNRDRGLWQHPNKKECPDWHFMRYQSGACNWEDIIDNDDAMHRNGFQIERHALQILTPVDDDGDLQCFNETLGARYPRLDYSKGFPNWWHLAHTEISVPSEHTQEGKRYDAEVTLAHFYEMEHYRNQLGKVVIFLEAYDDIEPWPFLDKLICQWRETEEKIRDDCGKDSVTTYYPGCTNYDRGHTPQPTSQPTPAPLTPDPTPAPHTSEPTSTPPTPNPTSAPATTTPVTTSPVVNTPAPTDVPANNTVFYERCNICGGENMQITNPDPIVYLPAFPQMTCAEFVGAGMYGLIRPEFCRIFPAFVGQCDCVEVMDSPDTSAPEMDAPETNAPGTEAPGTDAPGTSAPKTNAPATEAPGTDAPGTSAPETDAPGTEAPGTDAPGTSAPDTPVPGTNAPGTSAPATTAPESSVSGSSATSTPGTAVPITASPTPVPAHFECPTFNSIDTGISVNYKRMCEEGGCCDATRSSTNFCHDAYSFFDELMDSVCYWCCGEEGPKHLAAAAPLHPEHEPIDCSEVDRPNRICNPDSDTSCCGERSDTSYCQEVYEEFPGTLMNSVCWYCCSTPLLVEPEDSGTRNLRLGGSMTPNEKEKEDPETRMIRLLHNLSQYEDKERQAALRHPNADARMNHLKPQSEHNLKPEYDALEEERQFQDNMNRFLRNEAVVKDDDERRRRRLVNYEDVEYSPYEWLVKVETEYYYRYEGTQAVPPCKDQVHWRIMKDPIRVARRQIEELERLQMERIAPEGSRFRECKTDHAGARRRDVNGTRVEGKYDFARPVQAYHKLHRKVFCECKDWKSKFPADRAWCNRNIFNRFYEFPYNFDSGGEF